MRLAISETSFKRNIECRVEAGVRRYDYGDGPPQVDSEAGEVYEEDWSNRAQRDDVCDIPRNILRVSEDFAQI